MAPLRQPARTSADPTPSAAVPVAAVAAAWIFAAGVLSACRSDPPKERSAGDPPPAQPAEPGKPAYLVPIEGDSVLARGQSVWIGNCLRCHASGLAGAPVIATAAWGPRAAKGLDTLFAHALNGFEGPTGTQMPARGGNPALSDDEVKSAVRFMVSRYISDTP
jgi:cytochrome c5